MIKDFLPHEKLSKMVSLFFLLRWKNKENRSNDYKLIFLIHNLKLVCL